MLQRLKSQASVASCGIAHKEINSIQLHDTFLMATLEKINLHLHSQIPLHMKNLDQTPDRVWYLRQSDQLDSIIFSRQGSADCGWLIKVGRHLAEHWCLSGFGAGPNPFFGFHFSYRSYH